ncbi:alpha/beta fold hydrolase [Actinokineospora diospyrosa]|uniref:Pimeloyl-[acyl-carrier protein] methyl ester esterase n=1 Tax=Actinokineospora diospyrosa TaxID=103728 RepID=A0ABT1I9T2_9PSEU|nr:alpha/beta hydrolase [Actinokineospora diospyrosa]MCP2269399.1 pimeloyl-[acyl-carrier protein] methyl ester esterase [Actinokineospora diospyrosa]
MSVGVRLLGGDGPVVVAAHGVEDRWDSWRAVAERFPGRFYALDLPWRAGNDYRWTSDGDAGAWLRRALDEVPEPVEVLIGHSFGANAVLQHLAEVAAVPALLLVPFYPTAAEPYERAYADFRAIMAEGLRLRLGSRVVEDELVDAMVDQTARRAGEHGLGALFDQFRRTAKLPLAEVRTPTMVLTCSGDRALPPDRAHALAAAMLAAEVRLVPGGTHFQHLDRPERVAAALTEFTDREGSDAA